MMAKKRILFITQNLARTGSEIVLWHLLKSLDEKKYAIYVFCLKKGELFDVLPEHIEKSVVYKASGKWNKKIGRALLKFAKVDPFTHQLKYIHEHFRPDFWFVNTLAIPDAHHVAALLNVKVVTYFHELQYAFSFIKAVEMERIITNSAVCIGCSEEVCDKLADFGHPNIQLQSSFIDTDAIHYDIERTAILKQKLGISADDFVWVISGGATYMKGVDYIIPILEMFPDKRIKILWIGTLPDDGLLYYIKQVANEKFKDRLLFVGPQTKDYYNYFAIGSGYLLLSREESFSVVMLEAAYLGIPIVAFNAGIALRFIKPGMGRIIESRKVEDLILQMQWLHENPIQDKEKLRSAAQVYSLRNQFINFEKLLDNLFP